MVDRVEKTGRFDPLPQSGFTTAYFHRPEELHDEVSAAGFEVLGLVGLEGIGFVFDDVAERWADPSGERRYSKPLGEQSGCPSCLG